MTGRLARRTTLLSALAFAGVLATVGCRTGAPMGNGAPRQNTATLSVQNNGFYDRVVYVTLGGGMRARLGIARGASTTRFTIPSTFVLGSPQVRFIAEVLGGIQPSVSRQTQVSPGDTVDMVIMGS